MVSVDDRAQDEAEPWVPEPGFTMHYQVIFEDGRQITFLNSNFPEYEDRAIVSGQMTCLI